jgi:uncharacterized protein
MAKSVLVDAGFLVALLNRRDEHHSWAANQASELPPPWFTCESVLSEAFHLSSESGAAGLCRLLERSALLASFSLADNIPAILKLIEKYANVPMGLADACLVRMTEIVSDPVILTTDEDFRVYRRHGRQVVPCITPS